MEEYNEKINPVVEEVAEKIHYVSMDEYCDMSEKDARNFLKGLKKETLKLRDIVRSGKNPLSISALKEHMNLVSVYSANKYRSHSFRMEGVPTSLRKASRSKQYKKDVDSYKKPIQDTQE